MPIFSSQTHTTATCNTARAQAKSSPPASATDTTWGTSCRAECPSWDDEDKGKQWLTELGGNWLAGRAALPPFSDGEPGGYTGQQCQRAAGVPCELEVQLERHSDGEQEAVLFPRKGLVCFTVGRPRPALGLCTSCNGNTDST